MLTIVQIGVSLGPRCLKVLKGDPPGPPYWFPNWAVDASNSTASRMLKRAVTMQCKNSGSCHYDVAPRTIPYIPSTMIIICGALLLGFLLVWIHRGKSENGEVFTSPARTDHSDLHFTRHYDTGREVVRGQGVITKQRPEDSDYPGTLRRRLPTFQDHNERKSDHSTEHSWSSYNSSAETLVSPWNPPKDSRRPSTVSLHDKSKNEKHEGLIELDVCGKRKAFFKPSTGEFFHISPWKSTHSDDDSSEDEDRTKRKAEEKHSTHRALGQMVMGGVSWAAGK